MDPGLHRLRRDTAWHLERSTAVQGDVGHPQGMTRWGDRWLVTTVHPARRSGECLVIDLEGTIVATLDLTDGERFHPGGISSDDDGCWIAVAEYRPRSTTTVVRLDRDLDVVSRFAFDDHLGAICPLGDGTLFAVSWGSRRWYRTDPTGRILERRSNPNRFVDFQDLQHLGDDQVLATGVGALTTQSGPIQLGALSVIDVATLTSIHDTPIAAWMPSGRVATYNAAHVDVEDDPLRLHCLVDDTTAHIATWVPTQPL